MAASLAELLKSVAATTRRYGTPQRLAVGSAAVATVNAVGAKEVMLHATTRCFILADKSESASATVGIPLEAGEKFHIQIDVADKISVVRDAADGFLYVVPVVPPMAD